MLTSFWSSAPSFSWRFFEDFCHRIRHRCINATLLKSNTVQVYCQWWKVNKWGCKCGGSWYFMGNFWLRAPHLSRPCLALGDCDNSIPRAAFGDCANALQGGWKKSDSDGPVITAIGGPDLFNLVVLLSTCFLNFAWKILSFVKPEIAIAALKSWYNQHCMYHLSFLVLLQSYRWISLLVTC